MNFDNLAPFPALAYGIVDSRGAAFEVVVARGTYALRVGGSAESAEGITHVAVPLDDQPEIVVTDAYHGEINRSSIKVESDLAQQKPRCDVVVIGSAHSPTGAPVARIEVGIHVARGAAPGETLLQQRLLVHGPRDFVRRDAGWDLTRAEPFTELPIRYEHAFGGELRVDADAEGAGEVDAEYRLSSEARAAHPDGARAPVAHTVCPHNPVGTGWLEGWYANARSIDRWPAPRIEAPGGEITAAQFGALVRGEVRARAAPALTPRGFGLLAKAWQPRLALAGTLDAAWIAQRWPLMPLDFDMAYWNGAPPEMQCPYLFGGERVELSNLLQKGAPGVVVAANEAVTCRFAVPLDRLGIRLEDGGDQECWLAARIDTLIIDLTEMRLALVWRAVIPAAGVAAATLIPVVLKPAAPSAAEPA